MDQSKGKQNRRTIVNSDEEEEQTQNTNTIDKIQVKIDEPKPEKVKKSRSDRTIKKPKNEVVVSEETKEKQAFELINKMRECYKSDVLLNQQMKPSTSKLANIDEIVSKIIKKETQEVYIKMGILKDLKVWLEPLPDNSLPSLKIKRVILDGLNNLRVTKDDLLNSGIGKIVNFYSKNSKEAVEIRKKATQLIKKWKGLVVKEETDQL